MRNSVEVYWALKQGELGYHRGRRNE